MYFRIALCALVLSWPALASAQSLSPREQAQEAERMRLERQRENREQTDRYYRQQQERRDSITRERHRGVEQDADRIRREYYRGARGASNRPDEPAYTRRRGRLSAEQQHIRLCRRLLQLCKAGKKRSCRAARKAGC